MRRSLAQLQAMISNSESQTNKNNVGLRRGGSVATAAAVRRGHPGNAACKANKTRITGKKNIGLADNVLAGRQAVLTAAHAAHPERFVLHPPRPLGLPSEVWINPRPMGRNPVCYNYRATLISYRSCLKPVDTFRTVCEG